MNTIITARASGAALTLYLKTSTLILQGECGPLLATNARNGAPTMFSPPSRQLCRYSLRGDVGHPPTFKAEALDRFKLVEDTIKSYKSF